MIHLFMHAIPCIDREFYFFVNFPSFLILFFFLFWIFKLEWQLAVLGCTSEIDVLFTPEEDDLKKPSGLSIKKSSYKNWRRTVISFIADTATLLRQKPFGLFFFFFF